MKRKIALIFVFLTFVMLIVFYNQPNNIILANEKTAEEQLDDSVDEQVDKLKTDDLENYFNNLSDDEKKLFNNNNLRDIVIKIAKGNYDDGLDEMFNVVFQSIIKSFVSFLPSLISIIFIAILYGILSGLNSGFLNKSTNEIIYFVCYAAIIILLLNTIISYVKMTSETVLRLKSLMDAMLPLFLTLMTALGGVTSVGLYQPLMVISTGFIIKIIAVFIIPCFIAGIVFTIVGNLSKNVKLDKFTNFFKSVSEWTLGIVFSLFMMFVTIRGIAGRTIDGIGITATKFAISSYVPILGGYISDGFDLVLASCILIKNSLGITGLLIILTIILLPIIKLIVFTISLKLASSICEPLCDNKIADLLHGLSKSMTLLLSVLFGVAFMYFIVIMLVMFTCNLGVV
ncbi:MAG: stage III sporulation protein AE [Clostridia bacterium]